MEYVKLYAVGLKKPETGVTGAEVEVIIEERCVRRSSNHLRIYSKSCIPPCLR